MLKIIPSHTVNFITVCHCLCNIHVMRYILLHQIKILDLAVYADKEQVLQKQQNCTKKIVSVCPIGLVIVLLNELEGKLSYHNQSEAYNLKVWNALSFKNFLFKTICRDKAVKQYHVMSHMHS